MSGPFITRARAAEFVFKVAHPLAATHPTNLRLKEAADQIAKDSDGRIELRLFPNNQLGGEVDLLNQVRSGAVEMFVVGGLVASSVVPMAALDGVGFAFKDYGHGHEGRWTAALGAHIRAALHAGQPLRDRRRSGTTASARSPRRSSRSRRSTTSPA